MVPTDLNPTVHWKMNSSTILAFQHTKSLQFLYQFILAKARVPFQCIVGSGTDYLEAFRIRFQATLYL